tara:strand:- start:73 stop:306 length:234 start_codon:yes stop_codon:yes gene_type:complete
MKNVPKLIKALTAKGLRHEAEHVQAELKAAISGSKDPSKVLSNCADALQVSWSKTKTGGLRAYFSILVVPSFFGVLH